MIFADINWFTDDGEWKMFYYISEIFEDIRDYTQRGAKNVRTANTSSIWMINVIIRIIMINATQCFRRFFYLIWCISLCYISSVNYVWLLAIHNSDLIFYFLFIFTCKGEFVYICLRGTTKLVSYNSFEIR